MANNLKIIRVMLNLSQPDLAQRMGTTKNQLAKLESGARRLAQDWIERAARATGLPPEFFVKEHVTYDEVLEHMAWTPTASYPAPAISDVGQRRTLSDQTPAGGQRDLPNFGTAVGGGGSDGDFRLNGEITERIARPPALVGRKKAFSLTMQNDSMHPLYKPGKNIYIDPDGLRPAIGDEVLIEMYPEEDGEPGAAYVKTLVARGPLEVVVSQFNPPKELRFEAAHIKQILRVIPYDELLGV